jgi:DNA-binding IclR family transcriptional regulator
MLNTIRRAGSVLTLFTEERPDWGVREVAAELGMPRSNAHELMSSLATIGLLQRTPDARYRLGWRLLTLSGHLVNSTDVARIGSSVLTQLASQHRQTVSIATLDTDQIVSIGQAEPPGSAPVSRVGDRLPAHSTAAGKILLARLGMDPGDNLKRLTRNTVTDPELLRRQLAMIRRGQIAFDRRETDEAVCCVASPIRDMQTGTVVAAVSLCAAHAVFDRYKEAYTRSIADAARRISHLISPDGRDTAPDTARSAHVTQVISGHPARPDSASA